MDTSYLTTQVTTIIGQLHSIFDEIGVPRNEREARETELFAALSETLHNHLRQVNAEKTEMTEEAHKIIKTIKEMEASLDDDKQTGAYDLDTSSMRVTYPLNICLQDLKEKYNAVSRLHKERFEQVKKLVQALESYSSHLESSFVKVRLPPTSSNSCPPNFDLSPSYVTTLDEEFTKVYDEYNKRVTLVQTVAEEMIRLWSELGIPQAQTDTAIVQHYRTSPEQLGLHQADIERIKGKRDKLLDEKRGRERRLREIKSTIEALWNRLGIDESERRAFLATNRGFGLRTINEFEDELARLNELKRQNLHLFVEDARVRLQELWDGLYFSEEEMLDFTPAFSDVYSDALLSAHEAEIERLQTLKEQRAPILAVVDKHRSLINDRDALAASANDASRLMARGTKGEKRDPTRLLREEKMRKRITKELPKVTTELIKTLERYEEEWGRPFLVHGERYLDEIAAAEVKSAPPRSKTPNGLPPRPKTPSVSTSSTKQAPTATRPVSVMRGPPPSQPTARTPVNSGSLRRNPVTASTLSAPASQIRSPSKIPSRVPLSNLQHGSNSPERRGNQLQHTIQPSHAQTANSIRKMAPPKAPPPKIRELFHQAPDQSPVVGYLSAVPTRAESVVSSSDSNSSGKSVRPTTPEDVYDDRERMSYMSASVINHEGGYGDNRSQISGRHFPADSLAHSQAPSRQISNTSSNLTSGSGASGSENWETYSDVSELEPERDARDAYYGKVRAAISKRPPVVGDGGGYGLMAPPPKLRPYPATREREDDQRMLRVDSHTTWRSEVDETY